jgi:hypothetical protein
VPWLTGKGQYNKYMNNGWRMRELGEYVSMTALQRKTMAAPLPRGMREYPKTWRDAWKVKDGPIVPFDVIRKYYIDKHIAFDQKYTSTYSSSKVGAGIGLSPDDDNWSDHGDQYTLKPFPQVLRNKDWGFDRHGAVKLTKEEKAALPGGKRSSSKKAKVVQVVVSEDEAEAADHLPSCWTWYEADEAEVRAQKQAKLSPGPTPWWSCPVHQVSLGAKMDSHLPCSSHCCP